MVFLIVMHQMRRNYLYFKDISYIPPALISHQVVILSVQETGILFSILKWTRLEENRN